MKRSMSKKTKRVLRATLISFTILLFIAVGAIWFLAGRLESIIRDRLVEEVRKSTDGLYTLQMGKVDVNPTNGKLQIKDLNLLIDSLKLYQLSVKNEKPQYTANITIKSIVIDVNKLFSIRKGAKLSIGYITIDEPNIMLVSSTLGTKNTIADSTKTQHATLPFFSSAVADRLEITSGSMCYYHQGIKDTSAYTVEHFSLNINNIAIDSTVNYRTSFIHTDNAIFHASNIKHHMLDSALLLSIKEVSANLASSQVSIDSLAIKPQYGKQEFAKKAPNHSDIVDLYIKNIQLSGVHFSELLENRIAVDSMAIDSVSFWSYKNKQIPPVKVKEKPLLHHIVQQIPIPISISKIKITNGEASYEELAAKGKDPGKISFTNLNAEITGLTNIATDKSQLFTIRCNTKLFGKGAVTATINLPVDPQNDYFELAGTLGKMDMIAFNQIVTPLAFVEVKSGTVDHLDFVITGNSKTAKTNMTFLYSNLKINVLNPKKEDHAKRKFVSNVVNALVIKSNNPSGRRDPRKATAVVSERNRFLSNFNYWWCGIREGMLHSLGIPGK